MTATCPVIFHVRPSRFPAQGRTDSAVPACARLREIGHYTRARGRFRQGSLKSVPPVQPIETVGRTRKPPPKPQEGTDPPEQLSDPSDPSDGGDGGTPSKIGGPPVARARARIVAGFLR